MEFIETRVFTRQVSALLTDDEYRGLQQNLIVRPAAGALIRHGGADTRTHVTPPVDLR